MVKLKNYARPLGLRGDTAYFQWKVFVDEPEDVLDKIQDVQYILHPTFPEPVQDRRDPTKKFALVTSGWGNFKLAARVTYKDGTVEDVTHDVDLRNDWPEGA